MGIVKLEHPRGLTLERMMMMMIMMMMVVLKHLQIVSN
jgi:hypothetical protein